jgi:hypothetical protein
MPCKTVQRLCKILRKNKDPTRAERARGANGKE